MNERLRFGTSEVSIADRRRPPASLARLDFDFPAHANF